MSDRAALQIAILKLVEKAAAEGTVVDVKSEGIRIATEYPRSGFNIEDIYRRIERIAVLKSAAVSKDLVSRSA